MDEVKRRLALIDAQLAGKNPARHIVRTAPLVFPAFGLITGILLQHYLFSLEDTGYRSVPIWAWLALLAAFSAATACLAVYPKWHFNAHIFGYAAFVCFVCLGALRLFVFAQPASNDIRKVVVGNERKLATIRGVILTDPYINRRRDWQFAKFMHTDPSTSFYLKLSQVESSTGWVKATGKVRVHVEEPIIDLKPGRHIEAYCWLSRFKPPGNPGQFNTKQYLERKNVHVAAFVKSRDSISVLDDHPCDRVTRMKTLLRQKAAENLLGDLGPDQRSRGLLEALLLGYRRDIDSQTYRAFEKTGLLHFISLSGLHLGILVGTAWYILGGLGVTRKLRALVCIIAVALFLLIVPARAPTLRAAIIAWFFCLSFLFGRRPSPLNTLSLAAIVLLLIRPTQLFEVGWQLSFTSVLGIILLADRIHFFLYEKLSGSGREKQKSKAGPFWRIISKPTPYLLRLFTVGLGAWLGGAGILLYHFHTVTPLASLWTVVTFPFVAALLVLGFLKIILFLILPSVSAGLGLFVGGLAELLIRVVSFIADLNISRIQIGRVSAPVIILYYGTVLFVAFAPISRRLIKRGVAAAAISALVILPGVTKWRSTHPKSLVMTCLDVGHGQAILVRLPGGGNVLLDAGSLYTANVGRRIVAPYLDWCGIAAINSIIISHNDVDHINGIPEVCDLVRVGGIYASQAFFSLSDRWGTAAFLKESLLDRGYQAHALGEHPSINGPATIKVLWPTAQFSHSADLDDNDRSVVTLIEFAGCKVLLCSDIERFAQSRILEACPDLRADIVVAPHHGSARTIEPAFLKALSPQILICSCSRSDYEKGRIVTGEGIPRCLYTGTDGAVTIAIEKEGEIRTETFCQAN